MYGPGSGGILFRLVGGQRSPVTSHRWSSTVHMQPHSSSRTGPKTEAQYVIMPPPFVFPLAPPVIFIGWKADFLKALTQGANICVPPSLWGRIHYNSSNPPLPTLYLFMCILGVKVNNVHLHQAFMQVHRHLKCEPPPPKRKEVLPNKTNISRVMIKIEIAVPCRTSPERTAFRSLFNALRSHRRTCLGTPPTRTDADDGETVITLFIHQPPPLTTIIGMLCLSSCVRSLSVLTLLVFWDA